MYTPFPLLRIAFLFKLVLWLLLALGAAGVQALQLQTQPVSINLTQAVEVLEDPDGTLGIDAVRAPEVAAQFKPVPPHVSTLNFGFTQSAYWLRLKLHRAPSTQANWLLELPYTNINTLDFYPPEGVPIFTGSQRALSSRSLFHRHFAFSARISTEPQYFYIRATSRYALTLPLVAWTPDAFSRHQHKVLVLQFLYTGVMLALIFYNLMLFVAMRDQRFLLYCCYAFFLCLGMLAGNGYGRLFLWPDAPTFDDISQGVLLGVAAVFAALFVRSFLQTVPQKSLSDKLLIFCSVVFTALALLLLGSMVWHYEVTILHQIMMFTLLLLALVIVQGSLHALLRNDPSIRFFALAWLVFMLGVSVAACRAMGWLPTNTWTAYAVQMASSAEMLLLALALGDIVLRERHQRENAQQQIMNFQSEKLIVLNASKDKLEAAVQERTEQLRAALEQEKEVLTQYKRFGTLIAHEFRNPLAIIDSQLSVLRKQHEKGINQVEERTKVMAAAAQRLRRLFDKWLQSDQLNYDLLTLQPSQINLRQWLTQLAEVYAYRLHDHTLRWQWAQDASTVWAEEWALEVAVGNLLENACKYSPAGSEILIETRSHPGWVGIAITDQGRGIASALHEAVFKPFFRAETESTIYGMGLGLHLVQRIAHAHHGRIDLQSQPAKGSSFCLWLPVSGNAPNPPLAPCPP